MKKFHINGIGDFLRGFLATLAGIFAALLNPVLAFPLFGMAATRMGGYGKYVAYIAVGATVGMASQFLGTFTASFLGFLPGIFGTIAGWLVVGGVITFLVSIIMRAFGAGRK